MHDWYLEHSGIQQYCLSPRLANEYIAWPSIKELCGEIKGKRILDLGTASGETARKLALLGASCTGVDVSPEMLEIARRTSQGSGIEYLERDCSCLEGVLDNYFDLTIMNFLLCNINSKEKIATILKEAYRATKVNGSAIFTMHHPLQLLLRGTSLRDNSIVANDGSYNYFASGEKVRRLLKTYNGVAAVENFHWTIEDYIGSFVTTGFLIDAIKEPKPISPPQEFAKYLKETNSIPLYLVVRGIKNEG